MGIQVSIEVFLRRGLKSFRVELNTFRENQKGLGHINAACFYKQAEGEACGYLNFAQFEWTASRRMALGCNKGSWFVFCGRQECFCRKRSVLFVELYCKCEALACASFIQNSACFTGSWAAWKNSRQAKVANVDFREDAGADNEAEQEAEHEIEQVVAGVEGGNSHAQ